MKYLTIVILMLVMSISLFGQTPDIYSDIENRIPEKANKEFRYVAFFYNHFMNTNVYPTNDFLKGQVIGRLYGQNTTTTSDTLTASYFEQRIMPFFLYSPKLFDGRATLRASFEIDFTWGDVSYGSGGNFGSAPGADQVNIQTQNIEIELKPKSGWAVNIGLQRLYDTPHNPYNTFFEQMLNSSYRLNYWGTDGVGISVRRDADFYKWKAGVYQLYENKIQEIDDVHLIEFNYRRALAKKWHLGGSLYYVRDRANGQGGPSILGQGLNSTLADYNGTYRFPFGGTQYKADVAWLGSYFSFNEDLMLDQFFASGYVNYNLGATQLKENDSWEKGPSIGGLGANLRMGYRYGKTPNDAIWVDAIFTSGDENGISDGKYSGVMTGNTWATPGGLYVSHGGYLLFPHANVVNRYVAAVTDISNLGYGLIGGTVNLSKDFIPHKLNGKVGGAIAYSNVSPNGGGKFIGLESNLKLVYTVGVYMSVELHAAYLVQGDFYDSQSVNGGLNERPPNPYTAFASFRWLMF